MVELNDNEVLEFAKCIELVSIEYPANFYGVDCIALANKLGYRIDERDERLIHIETGKALDDIRVLKENGRQL